MKRQIELKEKKIEYTLKVSQRARKIRLTVHSDGNLIVVIPRKVNEEIAQQFIIEKSSWVIAKMEYFKNNPRQLFTKGDKKSYIEYKEKALFLVEQKIEYFNKFYNFKFDKVRIKNQKTRWGSCSRKGNLNFNYKIALISEKLADYIIIHELCHLKELNHSQKFWDLVAKTVPNYLERRSELRRSEIRL